MGKVKEIYKQNIYGVIATLIFHIVVLLVLIFSSLKSSNQTPEEEIFVDIATPEIKLPEPEMEKAQQSTNASQPNQSLLTKGQLASNRAVNDAATTKSRSNDPFFDNEYNAEVAAAKKLVSDVNKTLAQEIPKIGDIPMPVDNTAGKTREEVKQSNFKGKSNIHYFLENRFHASLPIPIYLAEGGGEVIVDIVVGRDGRVLSANPRQNPKITDLNILAYAKQAAEKTWFNEESSAPERQKGTITYLFVAQ
jgi:outer membrane biosynthesis protein TonB